MRDLLQFAGYDVLRERDLDLYIQDLDGTMKKILVLDNELAVYHTTVQDVAMRKSPTIKEMLSIRNAIKILNDADVVVSKRDESITTIHNECIDALDLSFDRSDLESIEKDGAAALENGFSEGVYRMRVPFFRTARLSKGAQGLSNPSSRNDGKGVEDGNG